MDTMCEYNDHLSVGVWWVNKHLRTATPLPDVDAVEQPEIIEVYRYFHYLVYCLLTVVSNQMKIVHCC